MAQPFDRKAMVPAPGEIDPAIGEFWIGNPWLFTPVKRNLSAYEPNRLYLNAGGDKFSDLSYLTGTDSDGDGRTAVAADIDRDGRQELLIRQVSGGAVMIFDNHFAPRHFLSISLRGTKSNRLGVGARIKVEASGKTWTRELYPACSFLSQLPYEVHFGLGDVTLIDRITVHWPSGRVDTLRQVAVDRHLRITEGG